MKFYASEPFEDHKVEAIRVSLENQNKTGSPTQYQVILDDLELIPRTDDVNLFPTFYDLLSPSCKLLTIHLYQGESRHRKSYYFTFAQSANKEQNLNGAEYSREMQSQIQIISLEQENKRIKEQNTAMKSLLADLKNDNKSLSDEVFNLREDLRLAVKENGLAGTVMSGMERLLDRFSPKPQVQASLAGVETSDGKIQISGEDYEGYKVFEQIVTQFTPQEFEQISNILLHLTKNKSTIAEIASVYCPDSDN